MIYFVIFLKKIFIIKAGFPFYTFVLTPFCLVPELAKGKNSFLSSKLNTDWSHILLFLWTNEWAVDSSYIKLVFDPLDFVAVVVSSAAPMSICLSLCS